MKKLISGPNFRSLGSFFDEIWGRNLEKNMLGEVIFMLGIDENLMKKSISEGQKMGPEGHFSRGF